MNACLIMIQKTFEGTQQIIKCASGVENYKFIRVNNSQNSHSKSSEGNNKNPRSNCPKDNHVTNKCFY